MCPLNLFSDGFLKRFFLYAFFPRIVVAAFCERVFADLFLNSLC